MKKKLLSILLTLSMVFTITAALSISVLAEDVDLSNSSIVLSSGTAYQNSKLGLDITNQVAQMGLVYDSNTSTWTMTNFTFTTTDGKALILADTNTTLTVCGTNNITGGTNNATAAGVLQCQPNDASVTINGAASGTNTLTITAVDSSNARGEIWAIDMEDSTLTIGDNVTVSAIAGHGDVSSYGLCVVSLTINGTGKLIAQSDENSDGTCMIVGSQPNIKIKNNADGSTPTWSDNENTYMNGSNHATAVTMTSTLPQITEGANQTIDVNNANSATFKSDASISQFVKVTVNGADLDATYYTVESNATIITLNSAYFKTLKNGTYTLGIVSTTGTASTTFTISGVVQATPTSAPGATPAPTAKTVDPANTGDTLSPVFYCVMLLASAFACVVVVKKQLSK